MDFHSLTRRALQSLCKKNKIQANMTNVAMADALHALPTVQGIEELQVSSHPLSSRKPAARPGPEEPPLQQQGSPLPRSRRVTATAPRAVPKPGGSSEEEEKKMSGATTTTTRRRTTRRQSAAAKEAGDDVGARRSTRARAAASKMADLRTEEEEEAKDVVKNVVCDDRSAEETGTKEGEGEKETNRMLPIEQPKEDQIDEQEEAEFSDRGIQEVEEHSVPNEDEAVKFSNGGIQVVEHTTSVLNDELGVEEAAQMNVEISVVDQNRDSEEEAEEEQAEFSNGVEEHHSVLNEEEAAKISSGGILVVEHTSVLNDELGVEEAAQMNVEISVTDQNGNSEEEEEEEEEEQNAEEQNRDPEEGEEEEEAEFSDGGIQEVEHTHDDLGVEAAQMNVEISVIAQNRDSEEEEAEFSKGEIQEVEEHHSVLNEEEAPELSNGGIQVEDELGVEPEQMNVEISMINQNRDSEEEEEDSTFQGSPIGGLISSEPKEAGDEESMIELYVDVPAATDQTSSDDLSPARLVQEDDPDSLEFVNGSAESARDDLTAESEQSSHGDDEEEPREAAAEISKTNEKEPENSCSVVIDNTPLEIEEYDEDDGCSAIDVPVQIDDFGDEEDMVLSGHLVGEIAVEAAAEVLSSKEPPVNIIINNNKENGLDDDDDDGLRKEEARLEKLSLRKLKAMYKDTLIRNKGEEKKRSALQALDENCLSLK